MEESEVSLSLLKRMYYAAQDGMAIVLYHLISDKWYVDARHLINHTVVEEDGQCSTLLMIAAKCGQEKVVKMLMDKFKPDLEQEGTAKFDGFVYRGVTALWCAAAGSHLSVVKTLVKAGADVNHASRSQASPLWMACYNGRLDVVEYLVEHGAAVDARTKRGVTCLMIAARRGHGEVVTFLLDRRADVHRRTESGKTALHYAAECGRVSIASELLDRGARSSLTVRGMSPPMVAAERARVRMVEYLLSRLGVENREAVDAYELLGASLANDKDSHSVEEAYRYLRQAMVLRHGDPSNTVRKELRNTVKAYGHWKECETMEEMESLRTNEYGIYMESLAIRERILGPSHPNLPDPIILRGAVMAENGRYNRCLDLWLHALRIKQSNNVSVTMDLACFAQVFAQMIHADVDLEFSHVIVVLEAAAAQLGREELKADCQDLDCVAEQCIEEQELSVLATLYILTVLTKVLALRADWYGKEELHRAYRLVNRLCVWNPRLKNGQTLLHLAVNFTTPKQDFDGSYVCRYPSAATAKLLIRCGADVNAMDNERNTPLHIVTKYGHCVGDLATLETIMTDLIEAGTHMDIVNSSGKTPYDYVKTGIAELVLRSRTKLSLKCLAARAIKAYNLSYYGMVPSSLEGFIELHGPGLPLGSIWS